MPSRVLKTKAEITREILDYLIDKVNEETHLEDIIFSGIIDEIDVDSDKISEILGELETEELIKSHDVSLKVYLPSNAEGEALYKKLTSDDLFSDRYMMIGFIDADDNVF